MGQLDLQRLPRPAAQFAKDPVVDGGRPIEDLFGGRRIAIEERVTERRLRIAEVEGQGDCPPVMMAALLDWSAPNRSIVTEKWKLR